MLLLTFLGEIIFCIERKKNRNQIFKCMIFKSVFMLYIFTHTYVQLGKS